MLKEMYEPIIIETEVEKGIIWKIFIENGKPIGYLSYTMINTKCKLYKIYIHPHSQKKGYGTIGLNEVKNFAMASDAKEIVLNVNRDNINSLNLYLKYGFKIEKDENNKMGDFFLNDYLMKFEISKV
jgi:ribosomal protein S18 acetylase RimI-like enzyme